MNYLNHLETTIKNRLIKSVSINYMIVGITLLNTFVVLALSAIILISRYDVTTEEMAINNTKQTAQNIARSIETLVEGKLDNLRWIEENIDYSNFENIDALQYMTSVNSDIVMVAIYDDIGNLLTHVSQNNEMIKGKNGTNGLSFMPYEIEKGNLIYYISPPHVNNMFQKHYPWVVTFITKTTKQNQNYYIVMDIKFSKISQYIDRILIGSRGYIFIANNQGELVYHPQQKLLYTKLKTEHIEILEEVYKKEAVTTDSNIYASAQVGNTDWQIVGVSNIDELVDQKKKDIIRFAMLVLFVALTISFIIVLLVMSFITKPIESLVMSIKQFENDVDAYVELDAVGIKEVQALQSSFNHMAKKIQQLMEQVVLEEKELRKVELKALQAQINPHFLYNTLDSIFWLCEEGGNKDAANMVAALSNTFRISISRGNDEITIQDEIKHVESYLVIQNIRYKDQFKYTFDIEPQILSYMCLKILLQPFVENAIYHGLNRMIDEGEILIKGYQKSDSVILEVIDNGVGMDIAQVEALYTENSDKVGVGVKNVHNRIQIYYGQMYGVSIYSELDEGTRVVIEIPIKIKEEQYVSTN